MNLIFGNTFHMARISPRMSNEDDWVPSWQQKKNIILVLSFCRNRKGFPTEKFIIERANYNRELRIKEDNRNYNRPYSHKSVKGNYHFFALRITIVNSFLKYPCNSLPWCNNNASGDHNILLCSSLILLLSSWGMFWLEQMYFWS